ncbi:MAG: formate dehydrogenase subunit alpha [Planctomycetes bacterium]|nr:formate dehydrogenase subunit alpha [Planctomycetota bacterium]
MPSITVNGKQIEFESGDTVLEAARRKGVFIPTLCYHRRLTPMSACRMCVVEIEGKRGLTASCTAPAEEGMVVRTDSDLIHDTRRMILQLLLAEGEHNCLVCPSNGKCELQDLCNRYGVDPLENPFEVSRPRMPYDDSSPVIRRDPNKCIKCYRCVRACSETVVNEVLDVERRGFQAKIVCDNDLPMKDSTCVSCGECVQVCPVGALTEKKSIHGPREWEMRKARTVCPYCGVGCQIELHIHQNEIKAAYGREGTVPNLGRLCVKGRFGLEYASHQDRLTKPLIKRNGAFEEATWEEALGLVAGKLGEIKEKHGPGAICVLSSARCSNEENYVLQKFARAVIGTNNVDHCARLCHAATVAGLVISFGSGAMTNSIAEVEHCDCILVTGSNTTETHPVIGNLMKQAVRKHGAKLIVVDPRTSQLTRFADYHLRQKPGTDVAWMNGMMHVILKEGLQDEKFITERTEGFEDLEQVLGKYSPEYVEEVTGIPADDLIGAARLFGRAERGAIFFAMGITQHTTGTDNVLSTANLAMLTGNVGRESTGVNPLRGQNNVQGACDLGALPNVYPGYQKVTEPDVQRKFEQGWGVKLSPDAGLTVVEMMNAACDGKVKALYIMGENPMLSDPNLNHVREALERLDFLVVQDIFPSETAQLADVVLPATCSFEKEGTFTNTERRIQRFGPALKAPGQARVDWEIVCDVAQRLGYDMSYNSASEIMDEIASLTPIYGGIAYDRLGAKGRQWPCPDRDHPGTKFLHKGKFSRGLGHFTAVEFKPPQEETNEEYPYILTTGRMLEHYHTGTMSRRVEGLNALAPHGFVEINPADAEKFGVGPDEKIKVVSRRGEIVPRAKITNRVKPGTVFVPFHFAEAAANVLTIDALDPISKIPEYKVCAVRIEKASE